MVNIVLWSWIEPILILALLFIVLGLPFLLAKRGWRSGVIGYPIAAIISGSLSAIRPHPDGLLFRFGGSEYWLDLIQGTATLGTMLTVIYAGLRYFFARLTRRKPPAVKQ